MITILHTYHCCMKEDIRLTTTEMIHNTILRKFFTSCKSHKNYTIAMSSAEAECMSMSNAPKENIYLKRLLNKLESNIKGTVIIKDDNESAMTITTDSVMNSNSKDIEIKFHCIRDIIKERFISLKYCHTSL
uniref:Uncharacterized protein n=1 Tax=Glossina austeni TaxID=7395 RepID=A0A1A9UIC9_GLOAU